MLEMYVAKKVVRLHSGRTSGIHARDNRREGLSRVNISPKKAVVQFARPDLVSHPSALTRD